MEISQRYNLVPVKDNCTLFAPTPYFQAQAIQQSSFKFLPCRPLLPWQRIILGQKLTTTRPPWKNCSLFAPTPYFRAWAMQWYHVNFSPKDPCCHGNQPFLFKDKIGCRLTRASNAATRLYSVAMGQIPRSTERISSIT